MEKQKENQYYIDEYSTESNNLQDVNITSHDLEALADCDNINIDLVLLENMEEQNNLVGSEPSSSANYSNINGHNGNMLNGTHASSKINGNSQAANVNTSESSSTAPQEQDYSELLFDNLIELPSDLQVDDYFNF